MRTLIVEDQAMFNDLLCKVCRACLPTMEIIPVDCAARARCCLQHARWTLMILDIHLPDADGFDFAVEALRLEPDLKIVGISADCSEYAVYRVLHSPLHAFLDKSSQCVQDLLQALRVIATGGKYYSPAVLARMQRQHAAADSFPKRLSPQERDVLRQVGLGCSDTQIGRWLGIASETVKWHRKQLMRRLGVKDQAELIVYANRNGFANLSSDATPPESATW